MKQYKLTGGARIGKSNASFPFAKLKVDKDTFEINASIIGNLIFTAKDIISIKPYQEIPILGRGIKVNHKVSNYNEIVIFWTFKNPDLVISEIKKTGFFENTDPIPSQINEQIGLKQSQGGFPVKKSVAIGAVIIWNLLFLFDFYTFFTNADSNLKGIFGIGIKSAIVLLLTTAILTLTSKPIRSIILKEGRALDDIKGFLYLIIIICCFFIFIFTMIINNQ